MSPRSKALLAVAVLSPLLAASDCGGFNQDDFRAPTEPASFFLQLTAVGGVTSLPADGLSTVVLVATIAPESSQKEIDFVTTAGALIGGADGGNDDKTTTVTAVGGSATVELRSAQQAVTARVVAMVKDLPEVSASIEIEFSVADADSVIRFTRAPASAPADGRTASFFTVVISSLVPQDQRTVMFATTNGSFTAIDPGGTPSRSTSLNLGAATEGTVSLYSPSAVGSAVVSAQVQSTTRSQIIDFPRAFPETIILELGNTTIQTTQTVNVKARLLRDIGIVTDGTVVTFSARDANGASFGTFTNVMTSIGGLATADFTPGEGATPGPATLAASTSNGTQGEIAIQVQ